MECIMHAMTDNDLYKFSQGQLVFNQFPNATVRYRYKNRSDYKFRDGFAEVLQNQIEMMSDICLTKSEFEYMKNSMPWLKPTYLQWLRQFRFNPSQVSIKQENGNLEVEIFGPWFETIYWEIPLLYNITQLRFTDWNTWTPLNIESSGWREKIDEKRHKLFSNGLSWIDFGTRRRFSYEVQDEVVARMKSATPNFRGTSNVFLAMKHKVKPQGTIAHESHMAMQALYGIRMADRMTMEHWVKEYRGNLGIALPDTLTTKKFLKNDFDSYFANLFTGIRQDSGDPFEIGEMVIAHYKSLDIDPMTKVIVFSDNLNVEKALAIYNRFKDRIKITFGIGTNFSCDVGITPMNHVIKMTEADFGNGPVDLIKLSDDPMKVTGNSVITNHVLSEIKNNERQ